MSESTLKEQALLERIGELSSMYENKIADLRVELTNKYNENTVLTNAQEAHVCAPISPGADPKEALEGVVTN